MVERRELELPVPISEQSDYDKMSGFADELEVVSIRDTFGTAARAITIGGSVHRRVIPVQETRRLIRA